MQIADYFLRVVRVDRTGCATAFAGTAFPVTPDGGILTARHVVDVDLSGTGEHLAIVDEQAGVFVRLPPAVVGDDPRVDLAFLPGVMPRTPPRYFPILVPSALEIGERVFTFGYYAFGGGLSDVDRGYFSGTVVNASAGADPYGESTIVLPYPVIEGMSGSPVLTYHNGVKCVGLAFGNRSSRILASEILDYEAPGTRVRETVHRIVEFGVAYHADALVRFLGRACPGAFKVSCESLNVYGLT